MSNSKLKWHIKPQPENSAIETNMKEVGLEYPLATLLAQRSIVGFNAAKSFFRINENQIHNPFLMKDMDKAADRLVQAINQSEHILVYGDYDVDGTTAVALMYSYLKTQTNKIDYYIPDRYKEGYGVSEAGIQWANDNNIDLIITLDCGIKANNMVDLANSFGIDVIVCDHHTPGNELPKAYAVLDPKRTDCKYPYKELTGCGVGYKLLCAYAELTDQEDHQLLEYADLLAISIAADIVPITGENRTLCKIGIERINTNPSIGLKTLLAARKKKEFVVSDLVFFVAPRINAAGRIKSGKHAVALMTAINKKEAESLASGIEQNNDDRRELDKSITEEALEIVHEENKETPLASTVVFQPHWHKGVVGIVASRLIEQHYKPTIVLTKSGNKIAGSARSVHGYSVYNAIAACEKHLIQFGGHKYAAGLTLAPEQLNDFKIAFESYVAKTISEDQKTPKLAIDLAIKLADITPKFFRIIKQMEPFGPENMTPVFMSENITAISARIVGDNHLKVILTDDDGKTKFDAIGFNLGHWLDVLQEKQLVKMVYTVEENEWQGNVRLQLNIRDIKI